jgi:hypothetical protein
MYTPTMQENLCGKYNLYTTRKIKIQSLFLLLSTKGLCHLVSLGSVRDQDLSTTRGVFFYNKKIFSTAKNDGFTYFGIFRIDLGLFGGFLQFFSSPTKVPKNFGLRFFDV